MSWTPIRYAHNGDVSIAYRVAGGGPVDLLFIGGFVSHLEIGVEPPLAERFWERMGLFARVIAFDKRGMGLSDSGAHTLENIVGDALAVLDACGVERVSRGHSCRVTRAFWGRMIEHWGDPISIHDWAPNAAHDPEVREWWARMLRSGASPRCDADDRADV